MPNADLIKKIRKSKTYRKLYRNRRFIVLIAAVLIWLCTVMLTSNNYNDFLESLAMRESSGDYTAINQFGYLGRWQLGGMALQDAGFQDDSGAWTELANAHGVYTDTDFLNTPKAQEAAVQAYHIKLCSYIRSYGLDRYLGKRYCDVKVTKSGLLSACHLVGVKAMADALASNSMVYDGNGVPAAEYMELFSGYRISHVWK